MKFTKQEINNIHKLCDSISIKDYEESTIKTLGSLVAQYNKTKEELENVDYSGENEAIKLKYQKRLEQKLKDLSDRFEKVVRNSRNSIQRYFKFDISDYYYRGENENVITAELQKRYDHFCKSLAIEKTNNLGKKMQEILGQMGDPRSDFYLRTGRIDYIPDRHAYSVHLEFIGNIWIKIQHQKVKEALKVVQRYYPHAYIDPTLDYASVYIPESDVKKL